MLNAARHLPDVNELNNKGISNTGPKLPNPMLLRVHATSELPRTPVSAAPLASNVRPMPGISALRVEVGGHLGAEACREVEDARRVAACAEVVDALEGEVCEAVAEEGADE